MNRHEWCVLTSSHHFSHKSIGHFLSVVTDFYLSIGTLDRLIELYGPVSSAVIATLRPVVLVSSLFSIL